MSKKKQTEKVVEETAAEDTGPKVTSQKEPTDSRREPRPGSPKDIVFQAGRQKEPGSIKAVATATEKTESNVRQHIAQCYTTLGYGYTIMGDLFTVDGETTDTWDDQVAAKEAAKAEKAAEKAASAEDADVEEDDDDDDIL